MGTLSDSEKEYLFKAVSTTDYSLWRAEDVNYIYVILTLINTYNLHETFWLLIADAVTIAKLRMY